MIIIIIEYIPTLFFFKNIDLFNIFYNYNLFKRLKCIYYILKLFSENDSITFYRNAKTLKWLFSKRDYAYKPHLYKTHQLLVNHQI